MSMWLLTRLVFAVQYVGSRKEELDEDFIKYLNYLIQVGNTSQDQVQIEFFQICTYKVDRKGLLSILTTLWNGSPESMMGPIASETGT